MHRFDTHVRGHFLLQNIFTGHLDPPLTSEGEQQALRVGKQLREEGWTFTRAFSSPLQRATASLRIILSAFESDGHLEQVLPVTIDTALNERDYGELNGRIKSDVAREYGSDQMNAWRRGYEDVPPGGESLKMTVERVWRFFEAELRPRLSQGERILVVSHGNTLRALMMALEGIDADRIKTLELGYASLAIYNYQQDGQLQKLSESKGVFHDHSRRYTILSRSL